MTSHDKNLKRLEELTAHIERCEENARSPHLHGLDRRVSRREAEEAKAERDALLMAIAAMGCP